MICLSVQLCVGHYTSNPYSSFRYDVTADGKKVVMGTQVEDTSFEPLHVVINWTAGLKK